MIPTFVHKLLLQVYNRYDEKESVNCVDILTVEIDSQKDDNNHQD
jgi:hypothetical protein